MSNYFFAYCTHTMFLNDISPPFIATMPDEPEFSPNTREPTDKDARILAECTIWRTGLKQWTNFQIVANLILNEYARYGVQSSWFASNAATTAGPASGPVSGPVSIDDANYAKPLPVASAVASAVAKNLDFILSLDKNPFLTDTVRPLVMGKYAKLHRTLAGFKRLLRVWRFARATVQVSRDLYLAELDPADKHTFALKQGNHIFYFTLSNLTNIINRAILHSDTMFLAPLQIKNPYNNTCLAKSDLYNIYFRVRETFAKVPLVLQMFFECEFDINLMVKTHDEYLTKHAIRQYAHHAPTLQLVQDIYAMLGRYAKYRPLKSSAIFWLPPVHPAFPRDVLIAKMRPYLELFYLSEYLPAQSSRDIYCIELQHRMQIFMQHNWRFGRPVYSEELNSAVQFNSSVPEFNSHYLPAYMQTHQYDHAAFNRYLRHGDAQETYRPRVQPPPRHSNQPQPRPQPESMYVRGQSPAASVASESESDIYQELDPASDSEPDSESEHDTNQELEHELESDTDTSTSDER